MRAIVHAPRMLASSLDTFTPALLLLLKAASACLTHWIAGLCRGFPIEAYKEDRPGLVLAYWGVALMLGRPLVSQTDFDYVKHSGVYGSLLNHITVGRHEKRAQWRLPIPCHAAWAVGFCSFSSLSPPCSPFPAHAAWIISSA
jgi:hypothetical protein